MGYTHYYTFNRAALTPAELATGFALAATEIERLKQYLPRSIKIKGGLGTGNAVLNVKSIWFNGDAKFDLDHETFHVERDADPLYPDRNWEFCKTARKPYDVLVCCALISLKRHLPGAFSFTSDGDRSDWASAIAFYNANTGGHHGTNNTTHLS
jgi:hypothetical protein